MIRVLLTVGALLAASGCASYGVVDNAPLDAIERGKGYSILSAGKSGRARDLSMMLAFSGGGTRAAAFAYGVMQELRNTPVAIGGRAEPLLGEVDVISSVSGGSFTAAYYGLHGDRIFDDFEQVFLRRDVQGVLLKGLFNPLRWFSEEGRTDMAVDYYEDVVFGGATFADMKAQGGPLVLINASDLGYGVRFSFVQEYFSLLCSDLASFPVARAVTASSAVPVLFDPVVVENHPDCDSEIPDWLAAAQQRGVDDAEMTLIVDGLRSYFDRDKRRYVHFVDGGITDNLGLRAIYDIIEVAGGAKAFLTKAGREVPRRLVVIAVDASTEPEPQMDKSNRLPSVEETVGAVTDVQLHRYNAATLGLMEESLERWAKEMSTGGRTVIPYFIQLSFRDVADPARRQLFNTVPTSFRLTDEQVDEVIAAGRELLRNNPQFRHLLEDLGGRSGLG